MKVRAHCPKCGGAVNFVSQKSHTIDFAEATFKCVNPKCGSEVVAEIKFAVRKTPADQCFTSGASNDAPAQAKTDC